MKQSDTERIKKIVSTWDALQQQLNAHSVTREQLLTDEFSRWAVTTPLYNIGEQVYKISDETKAQHPEIIWNVVSGLRHRLVHDYDGIHWTIIVEVIFDEMNDFVKAVKDLL